MYTINPLSGFASREPNLITVVSRSARREQTLRMRPQVVSLSGSITEHLIISSDSLL